MHIYTYIHTYVHIYLEIAYKRVFCFSLNLTAVDVVFTDIHSSRKLLTQGILTVVKGTVQINVFFKKGRCFCEVLCPVQFAVGANGASLTICVMFREHLCYVP